MTDANKTRCANVLALNAMDAARGDLMKAGISALALAHYDKARTAVAALIAERDVLRASYDDANRRATAEQEAKVRALFERDALAAEVKALDSEACKLRGELYALRNMLEGYEVSVQRNQLHGAGLTYLTEVQLLREFQPGVGESHAEWWKKTLARASAATGGCNG